jgi:spoIIIJ-associated protein
MAKNLEKVARDFAQQLLKGIGVDANVEVKQEEGALKVQISGENLGALIGYHGQTLESLQLILGLMINQKQKDEQWTRVIVDIGEYRVERENILKELVNRAVEDLEINQKTEVLLPPMNPSERRAAHVIVSENYPELSTASEGEEPYRRIKLLKK